jgi:glycine cleavage system aminomethyltransferase T
MKLVNAGLKALGSLRMEKAYKDYGNNITHIYIYII